MDSERPEKRQRLGDEAGQAADDGAEAPPPGPPPAEQLKQALHKIANHISSSAKFSKASGLLRQVMDALDKSHRDDFFVAVKAAFMHPENCTEPLLRKDYVKLIKAVMLRADVFSKRQQAQLEVYSVWALLQNELFTDDSFVFNKVVGRIKAAIAALPDGDEEQEAAWIKLYPEQAAALGLQLPSSTAGPAAAAAAAGAAPRGSWSEGPRKGQGQQQQPVAADESDPFGLDAFIAQAEAQAAAEAAPAAAAAAAGDGSGGSSRQQPSGLQAGEAGSSAPSASAATAGAAAPQGKASLAWDSVTCCVMHKQALLDCLVTAKTHQHKLAWARTSVELLIEEAAKPAAQGGMAGRFVGGQKQQLADLMQFVNSERAARRSGVSRRPGGKGTGEYMTSFEKARAEWGSASWVSARGKVGSQGDAKTQAWLG